MALSRYARTRLAELGRRYTTSFAIPAIRENIQNGNIRYEETVLEEDERLDILAGKIYGDGRLWWILAAASSVGFSVQCPAGTRILLANIEDCSTFIG